MKQGAEIVMRIGDREIGSAFPPFVIAEVSGNHDGSLERALEIVDAAAAAGADAIKLQTYTADSMTLDIDEPDFRVEEEGSLWFGERLYDLYDRAHTPWEWHKPIYDRARAHGLIAFSSAFDHASIDLLETLDTPCYKIASFENVDLPLIAHAAATGKPLIISTGMATREEIHEAVDAARHAGCTQLALLKCTSSYPAPATEANVSTIPDMRSEFACEIGISDHTLGIGVSVAAVALGACIIEKHITLDRNDGAVDSAFSMTPEDIGALVAGARAAWESVGRITYGPSMADAPSLKYRRSLYFVEALREGDVIQTTSVRSLRPGFGLAPKHLGEVIGRRVNRSVAPGTRVEWSLLQ